MRNREIRPALPARIAAWGITFLLTVTLTVAALGGPAAANRVLTNEELHRNTATEDSVIREQMEKASDLIRELAEDYHFSADDVIGALSPEELTEANEKAADWWTKIFSDGEMGEIPEWQANEKITDAVRNTIARGDITDEELEENIKGIVHEIEKAVNRTVMPFRKALVTLAVRYVNRKTDLAGIIRFVSQIPQMAAVISLLFAGLIALLTGKRIRYSLKYYGAAFAGAGLSVLTGILLIRSADISGMIRASSEGLNHQIQSMMKTVATETWACAIVLFAAGMVCLVCYNHANGTQQSK